MPLVGGVWLTLDGQNLRIDSAATGKQQQKQHLLVYRFWRFSEPIL